jgi:folylpolyglutamate synthase/dihydropteroate synthase
MVDELAAAEENMNGHFSAARQKDGIIKANREILCVLGQIELAQKACDETARRKLQDFGRQIKTVRHTKKGIDGYSNQMKKREAFFIDAKK